MNVKSSLFSRFVFFTVLLLSQHFGGVVRAQCINPSSWGGGTISQTTTTPANLSVGMWAGEFTPVNILDPGTYIFSSTISTDYLTFTTNTNVVINHGTSPLTVIVTSPGQYRVHLSENALCATSPFSRDLFGVYVSPPIPPSNNDAGVSQMTNPLSFCSGLNSVVLRVENFGLNTIDSVLLNWQINAGPVNSVWVNGPINPSPSLNFLDVSIGTVNVPAAGISLVAWTSLPNGVQDTINFNDTLSILNATGSINGTYTINSTLPTGGVNFNSFTAFANEVNSNGICGPVVVNVAPGGTPYIEQVVFDEIAGMSAINTITINGNGNTLRFSAVNNTARATLTLEGTDHLSINNLIIEAVGNFIGWGVHLYNQADSNRFNGCTVRSSETQASINFAGFVFSGAQNNINILGATGNYNVIENCTIEGGFNGITINGQNVTSPGLGNVFRNNVIRDFFNAGILVRQQSQMELSFNDISRGTRQNGNVFYGLFINGRADGLIINANRIHSPRSLNITNSAAYYGIFVTGTQINPGFEGIISNNLIYNFNGTSSIFGITLSGSGAQGWKVLHNTIILDKPSLSTNFTSRGIFISGLGNALEIKNNLFYLDAPNLIQHMIHANNTSASVEIDNNAFYTGTTNANVGFRNTLNYATLAVWQTTGFDVNGIFTNPVFNATVGASDFYRPTSSLLIGAGQNLLGLVDEDIESASRLSSPDPGAFNIVNQVSALDAGVPSLEFPTDLCSDTTNLTFRIRNYGSVIIDSVQLSWQVNNGPVSTQWFNGPIDTSGGLNPPFIDVTVGPASGFIPLTSSDIKAWTSLPNNQADSNNVNDTLQTTLSRFMSGTFTINPTQPTGGTNFNSFTDFADEVNTNGICGPVIINVAPGSPNFNEKIILNQINGMSALNTITINGNGNTLNYSGFNINDRVTLSLVGTDHLTIDSLIIQATGSFGWALHLLNIADSNTFTRCSFIVNKTIANNSFFGVVLNNGTTNALQLGLASNYNTFENCFFDGGSANIVLNGETTVIPAVGNTVRNCTLLNGRSEAIRVRSQDQLTLEFNEISRPERPNFQFNGIFINNVITNSVIRGNRIHTLIDPSSTLNTGATGVFFSSTTGSANAPNLVANNLLYNFNNRAITRGIVFSGSAARTLVLHNSIILDNPKFNNSIVVEGISILSTFPTVQDIDIKNNLIYLGSSTSAQRALFFGNGYTKFNLVDNNAFYLVNNQGVIARVGATDYATLTNWQTTGADINGNFADPLFLAVPGTSDFYRPTETLLEGTGQNVFSLVPADIELSPRSATPDPGAFNIISPCDTAPDLPTAFNLVEVICSGSNAVIRLNPDSNASSYEWLLPAGWIGTSTSDTIAISGIVNSDTIRVFALNPCGNSDTLSIPLNIIHSQLLQADTSICFGDSLSLDLAILPEPGTTISWSHGPTSPNIVVSPSVTTTYTVSLTRNGITCSDSITINLIPADTTLMTITACDSFFWSATSQVYTISGLYTETLLNSLGCDSIVSLDLSINSSDSVNISITECNSYLWPANNQTYTSSGVFSATLSNTNGCDSIVILNLTIIPSDSIFQQITVCDAYTWPVNNQTYTTTGQFFETFTKSNGCDSVVVLNLSVNPSHVVTQNIAACDSFVWSANNQVYSVSGTYIDTLSSSLGCDSVVILNLTISTANSSSVNITACNSYLWPTNNQTYTVSGIYNAVLTNIGGCDSTVTLNLSIESSDSIFTAQTACEVYTWPVNNQTYTTSGIYSTSFTKSNGCDSVIVLNLTIHPTFNLSQNQSACISYTWPVNNQVYTLSGIYTDTLTTINGCDSIITLNLTINPASTGTENITACGSYFWFASGQTYTSPGIYTTTLTNSNGCDSTVTLNLSINPIDTVVTSITACGSYQWPVTNFIYTGSGTYVQVLTNSLGCDSVMILNLTISQSDSIVQSISACNQFTWSETGLTYTVSGIYSVNYTSSAGCDSSHHLILTINEAFSQQIEIAACDEYFWPLSGNTYTRSGVFTANFTTAAGCDSSVVLNLTIFNSVVVNQRIESSVQYTWPANNITYSTSGMYQTVLRTAAGCDSVINLDLSIRDGSALYVPNAFTPNGNRLNEEFTIYGSDITDYHILIYNRFGQLIFESKSLDRSWDATFMGEPVPLGVYVYTIFYTDNSNQSVTKRGTVTVLR